MALESSAASSTSLGGESLSASMKGLCRDLADLAGRVYERVWPTPAEADGELHLFAEPQPYRGEVRTAEACSHEAFELSQP